MLKKCKHPWAKKEQQRRQKERRFQSHLEVNASDWKQTAWKPVKLQTASTTPAPRQVSQQARVLRFRLCITSVDSWTSETAKVYSEETAENVKMSENVLINNRPISILPISLLLLLKELNSWREKYAHILTFVVPQRNS